MADGEFRIKERDATAEGNLGPAPAGVGKPGRKKRADAGQSRTKGERTPRRKAVERKEVYDLVGFPIVIANEAAKLNQYWREKGSLTGTEIGKLSVALGDEAMEHKALLKYLQQLSGGAVHIRLAGVLMSIIIPRMAENGLLPVELASAFRAVDEATPGVAAETGADAPTEPARDHNSAVPNGTGGTREFYGSNGERKVNGAGSGSESGADESFESAEPATVQDSAPVEA